MSETTASLRRKIEGAADLQSVVRTMKAVAASSIGQYENSVRALADYYRSLELGLGVCLRQLGSTPLQGQRKAGAESGRPGAVVFGSDQGLVGRFNDRVADFALKTLADLPGRARVWTVGERVQAPMAEGGLELKGLFAVPGSVKAIAPLVSRILVESGTGGSPEQEAGLYLFYNRPTSGAVYEPVFRRLLPLDEKWRSELVDKPWPGRNLPQVLGEIKPNLWAMVREYLFASLFRACAESLASENASRLAAMQRADRNIDELLEELGRSYHRMRQAGIDEELFDLISGFEALKAAD